MFCQNNILSGGANFSKRAEFDDEELLKRIHSFLAYFFDSWVFDAEKANWWQGMNPHHKVNNCSLEEVNSVI